MTQSILIIKIEIMSKFKEFIDVLFGVTEKPAEQTLEVVEDSVEYYVDKTVLEQVIADAVANAEKADSAAVQANPDNYVGLPLRLGQKALDAVIAAVQESKAPVEEQTMAEEEVVAEEVEVEAKADTETTVEEVKEVAEKAVELASEVTANYITEDQVKGIVEDVVAKTLEIIKEANTAQNELKLSLEAKNTELEARLVKMEEELSAPSKKPTKTVPPVSDKESGKFSMQSYIKEIAKK
jgi:hypothetical protein